MPTSFTYEHKTIIFMLRVWDSRSLQHVVSDLEQTLYAYASLPHLLYASIGYSPTSHTVSETTIHSHRGNVSESSIILKKALALKRQNSWKFAKANNNLFLQFCWESFKA